MEGNSLFEYLKSIGYTNDEAKDTILRFLFGMELELKESVDIRTYMGQYNDVSDNYSLNAVEF